MVLDVRLTDYGIASRQGDTIYMNIALLEDPKLCLAILSHEEAHTSNYSMKDVVLDIKNPHLKGLKWNYWRFIMNHPSSWAEFLPVWINDKKIVINPLIMFGWGMGFFLGGAIAWILIG